MLNLIHNFWFIQAIGAVGLIFVFLSWSSETREKMLKISNTGLIIFIVHYFLLGAYTGALASVIALIRNLIFLQKEKKKWAESSGWFYIFVLLAILSLIPTWKGLISLLPVVAVLITTYTLFYIFSPAKIRVNIFIVNALWIPYCLVVHSYSGLANQIVGIAGVMHGMQKLDRKDRPILE